MLHFILFLTTLSVVSGLATSSIDSRLSNPPQRDIPRRLQIRRLDDLASFLLPRTPARSRSTPPTSKIELATSPTQRSKSAPPRTPSVEPRPGQGKSLSTPASSSLTRAYFEASQDVRRSGQPDAPHRTGATDMRRNDAVAASNTGPVPIPLGGASRIIGNSFRNRYLGLSASSSSSGLDTSSSTSSSGLGTSWTKDVMD